MLQIRKRFDNMKTLSRRRRKVTNTSQPEEAIIFPFSYFSGANGPHLDHHSGKVNLDLANNMSMI